MAVVALLLLTVGILLIAFGLFRAASWRRTPTELRGDWWDRFERQFRACSRVVELGEGPERRA
jgi:hypothetical protein